MSFAVQGMTRFYKPFFPFFSKRVHIHFNPSQNVSTILFLNGLVMVTNEGSIACNCFKTGNVRGIHPNSLVFRSYFKYFKYPLL